MASLFLLLLVLLVQAMALEAMMSDVKVIVLEQLEQLRRELKPGYKANVVAVIMVDRPAWSWKVVDRNTCIKLMMVVTSNSQHVMARPPCATIIGALVFSYTIACTDPYLYEVAKLELAGQLWPCQLYGGVIVLFGFICVWRWARVALQEDRPFLSLLSSAEPSDWRKKSGAKQ